MRSGNFGARSKRCTNVHAIAIQKLSKLLPRSTARSRATPAKEITPEANDPHLTALALYEHRHEANHPSPKPRAPNEPQPRPPCAPMIRILRAEDTSRAKLAREEAPTPARRRGLTCAQVNRRDRATVLEARRRQRPSRDDAYGPASPCDGSGVSLLQARIWLRAVRRAPIRSFASCYARKGGPRRGAAVCALEPLKFVGAACRRPRHPWLPAASSTPPPPPASAAGPSTALPWPPRGNLAGVRARLSRQLPPPTTAVPPRWTVSPLRGLPQSPACGRLERGAGYRSGLASQARPALRAGSRGVVGVLATYCRCGGFS